MVKIAAATLFAVADAATLAVTWSDCGDADTHAKVSDLQPTSIKTGGTTTLTGTGDLDEVVNGATFTMVIKADGVQVATCSGDASKDVVCKMPLGVGSITLKAQTFPMPVGASSIPVDVKVSSLIPASLAKTNSHITAVSDTGDKLFCMDVVTSKQSTWEDFKAEYGKNYAGEEEASRKSIFEANMAFIESENAKGHSYTLGMGPLADITAEEFKATRLGFNKPESDSPVLDVHKWQGEQLEDRIDWTEKNVVTPVKDQGQCGSCWAFSTTGAIESGYALSSGNLVSISEQQYVDCDGFPNLGCSGGQMSSALKWAKKHDLCTEESYPYVAKGGLLSSCKSSGCDVAIKSGTVTGVTSLAGLLGKASDEDMMSALHQQPLSIAIEADQDIFQHYKSGVITGNCGTSTDHGVLLVGYGTDGSDYWKVKNSWGASWGDNGFVRMVRGKNQCGINSGPNYPEFASSVSV